MGTMCTVTCRAVELFDWLRGLEPGHALQSLLDVYSYTAMISLCIAEQDAERALQVSEQGGEWPSHPCDVVAMNV